MSWAASPQHRLDAPEAPEVVYRRQLLDALVSSQGVPDAALADFLYTHWFTGWQPAGPRHRGEPPIARVLRAWHALASAYEEGWTAVAAGPLGSVLAERTGEQARLASGDFVNLSHPAAPVQPGDALAISRVRDGAGGGWWHTWSEGAGAFASASTTEGARGPLVRVYWHADADVAPRLVARLTAVLDERGCAFELKCPSQRGLFGRADAVVLYLNARDWATARAALRSVHEGAASRLRPEVPPLTLRLGAGVAAAEDPGTTSFGLSRAQAVAAGIASVRGAGATDLYDAGELMVSALQAHGIDPVRPYLCAPSSNGEGLAPW